MKYPIFLLFLLC